MASTNSKWNRLSNPPAPLFTNKKEKDFVKQITTELQQRIIPQEVLYYSLSIEHSNYHPLYGEAIEKVYKNPIHIHCFVEWQDFTTNNDAFGVDRVANINVYFHSRRIKEDQNLYVCEGDIIQYSYGADGDFYEIMTVKEPREVFWDHSFKVEVVAECKKVRNNYFKLETE